MSWPSGFNFNWQSDSTRLTLGQFTSLFHQNTSRCDDHPLNIGTSSSLLWLMTNFSFLLRRASSSVVMMVAFVRLDKWRGCFEMYWSSMFARAQSFEWCFKMLWNKVIVAAVWYTDSTILFGRKKTPWNLQICREHLKIEAFCCLGLLRLPLGFPSFFCGWILVNVK